MRRAVAAQGDAEKSGVPRCGESSLARVMDSALASPIRFVIAIVANASV
jgi:hypothetical protein